MHGVAEQLLHLKETLTQHPLFVVGLLLLAGYLIGRLAGMVKLPEITGFIIAGLVMGEAGFGVVSHQMGQSLRIVTEVALGLIALTIGSEFSMTKLRRVGRGVVIITLVQLLATFTVVTLALWFFRMELPYALLLGAIASATAPAATVAIVQSLRAHGDFVDYLYGVVALDDAGSVILFGVIFAFVSGLAAASGHAEVAPALLITNAVLEVVLSVIVGLGGGGLIHAMTRRLSHTGALLIITLGWVFLTTAVAASFHLSPLLTNMAAGAALINLSPRNRRLFSGLGPMTPPIYALFFVIAGTELNPALLATGGILIPGLVYIGARAIGKYSGVYLGGVIAKTASRIRDYLGICMLPQAGVAIGLVLLIQTSPLAAELPPGKARIVADMVNIVLLSVFFNELVGPPLSRFAIIRGNEMEE